jgi:3-methyladenine DNA glycosylase AlkD
MAQRDLPVPTAARVKAQLRRLADVQRAKNLARFFKSGRGQYGEGDRFLGIRVPLLRRIAQQNRHLPLADVVTLLHSPYHEERFTALEILVAKYEAGDPATQARVFRMYLNHTGCINNWDLVDTSARYIVGAHLQHRSR